MQSCRAASIRPGVQIDRGDLAHGRHGTRTAWVGRSLGLDRHGDAAGQSRDGGADDSRVVSRCGTVNGVL